MTKSIMVVGVGGQGTLLTSRILGKIFLDRGYDVKVSEVHGMSQRGGSVTTYIRYGEKVSSPTIEKGGADLILAFEKLEGYRFLEYIKPGALMIVNESEILPMPVITGSAKYPEKIFEKLGEKNIRFVQVKASELAREAGSVKCVNVVLLGVMAKHYEIDKQEFVGAIRALVPERFLEMNLAAFELGYGA